MGGDAGGDAAIDAGAADGGRRRCAAASECDDRDFCTGNEDCVDNFCVPGTPPCRADQTCDRVTATCGEGCTNFDDDGYTTCQGDCDDRNNTIHPGASEQCDGVDDDCNPRTFGMRDGDGDGFDSSECFNVDGATGTRYGGDDCDDTNDSVHRTAPEVCGNGVDDNCNGVVDLDGAIDGFVDLDGDGWGLATSPTRGCAGAGVAMRSGDCDDRNVDVHPEAAEICDHLDQDCSGAPDEGVAAPACTDLRVVDRCTAGDIACVGHCNEATREGYAHLGADTGVNDTAPGMAFFADRSVASSIDLGRRTLATSRWQVRLASTPASAPGHVTILYTPRAEIGPEAPAIGGVTPPGGVPILSGTEVGLAAVAQPDSGALTIYVWTGAGTGITGGSTTTLPPACRASTADREYVLSLEVDGPSLRAVLTATGCGSTTSTLNYAPFWDTVYGRTSAFPRYWVAALSDSDGSGLRSDLRSIEVTRTSSSESGNCVGCPWGFTFIICVAG